jgi:hypothetical protein
MSVDAPQLNADTRLLISNMYLSSRFPMFVVECGYCRARLLHFRWNMMPQTAVYCSGPCAEAGGAFL